MDGLTMKAGLVIGALLLIGFLWLIWKFFAKLFKHVVILMVLIAVGLTFGFCRYRSFSPPTPSYVGKHAYMKESGEYIGVVENQGEDSRRGQVWIIRPPGGYPQKYSKARVTLKDKLELKPAPTTEPTPESNPASDKADKKADVKKKKN